jgi:hypothetical protein
LVALSVIVIYGESSSAEVDSFTSIFYLLQPYKWLLYYLLLHLPSQVGGDIDGKLDEGSASLILDTKPSKVVSNELTVS